MDHNKSIFLEDLSEDIFDMSFDMLEYISENMSNYVDEFVEIWIQQIENSPTFQDLLKIKNKDINKEYNKNNSQKNNSQKNNSQKVKTSKEQIDIINKIIEK